MRAIELLEDSPVIIAIKNDEGLKRCLESECQVVFILYGNVCNIGRIVETLKANGKHPMIHVDMIQGLGSKEVSVDFLKMNTMAEGIISTKQVLVKRAVELGMIGVLRAFIVDSMAVRSMGKMLDTFQPDAIEIMPGIMPKIVKSLRERTSMPIIASGLISEKKEILEMISSGADAISTTKEELWFL